MSPAVLKRLVLVGPRVADGDPSGFCPAAADRPELEAYPCADCGAGVWGPPALEMRALIDRRGRGRPVVVRCAPCAGAVHA